MGSQQTESPSPPSMLREIETAAKRAVNFRDGITRLHMKFWGVAVCDKDLKGLGSVSYSFQALILDTDRFYEVWVFTWRWLF